MNCAHFFSILLVSLELPGTTNINKTHTGGCAGAARSSFGDLLCHLVYSKVVVVSCRASTCICLTGICHGGQ